MIFSNEMLNAIGAAKKCTHLYAKIICVEFDDVYFYNCDNDQVAIEFIGAKLANTVEEFERRTSNIEMIILGTLNERDEIH